MIKHQGGAGEGREERVGGLWCSLVAQWAHNQTWSGGIAACRGVAVAQGGAVMPPIELECPAEGCTRGEDGSVYKTPPLPSGEAIQMLTFHIQLNHPQSHGSAVGQQQQGDNGARVGCKAEKVPRPVQKKGQSEDKFLHFSCSRL